MSAAGVPVVPRYGVSTLADVLPSVAGALGISGHRDVLGLPPSQRVVVVLVDGLGHRLLQRHLLDAPYLAELFGDAHALTSGVPSTTATSITSLGTGLAPGRHGIAGWTFRRPDTLQRMNSLSWDRGPAEVEMFQPNPTVFEQAVAAGVVCTSVTLPRFDGSGLTRAALRGARMVGVLDTDDDTRLAAVVRAATASERTLTYVYESRLDHTGHAHGCESGGWQVTLGRVDALLERLRTMLPDDVALLVTGDHGMVDAPAAHRLVAEEIPGLMRGVSMLAGEARLRQLYVEPGQGRDAAAARVARRWADELGERAWVRTRAEAVDEGWFGSAPMGERFGDVLVALRGDWAIMSREFPQEFSLVGMHGSLTPDEMQVPLLVDHPASEWAPAGSASWGATHG